MAFVYVLNELRQKRLIKEEKEAETETETEAEDEECGHDDTTIKLVVGTHP